MLALHAHFVISSWNKFSDLMFIKDTSFCLHISLFHTRTNLSDVIFAENVILWRHMFVLQDTLWEILAKYVQKTFPCNAGFKPVTSRISKCQSHLAIKFYSYFWWISRNLNKVLKSHRNFCILPKFWKNFSGFFDLYSFRACQSVQF